MPPRRGRSPRGVAMSRWRRRIGFALGSIKLRVMLSAVAAMALGVLLTAVMLVRQAERDTLANQRDRELAEVVNTASQLSQRVVERQRALRASAEQFDAAMLADNSRLQNLLDNKPLLRGLFTDVFVTSTDGRVRAYADSQGVRTPAVDVSDREYFRRTVIERRRAGDGHRQPGVVDLSVVIEVAAMDALGVQHRHVGDRRQALAGAAGALIGVYDNQVWPTMGSIPAYKCLAIVVLGGLGNIPGSVLASFLIGLAETLLIGGGGTAFNNANAYLGVGASATAWSTTQTDLIYIVGRNHDCHSVSQNAQNIELLIIAGNFLDLDSLNDANTMGWIYGHIADLKIHTVSSPCT